MYHVGPGPGQEVALYPISTIAVTYPSAVSQVSRLKIILHFSCTSKPSDSRRNHDILDSSNFQPDQCHHGDLVHSKQQSGDKCSSFSRILRHNALPQNSQWYLQNSTQTCLLFLCCPGWAPAQHYQNIWVQLPGSNTQKLTEAVKLLHDLLKSSLITT